MTTRTPPPEQEPSSSVSKKEEDKHKGKKHHGTLDRKQFGEDIAFGVEQTIACWATDFIDPWVGAKIQTKLEPQKTGNETKYA